MREDWLPLSHFLFAEEFWRGNNCGGWATLVSVLVILAWQLSVFFFRPKSKPSINRSSSSQLSAPSVSPRFRISGIVTDADLKNLIDDLEEKLHPDEKWENVIDKRNTLMSYNAKCCKPKDGPLKYISVTVFENCSTKTLRDFYMDNDYRKLWDKTLVEHEQLQVDETSGTEIGRTVKKFPLLTPREYVLAWRLWEGENETFYCFIRECEHSSAPLQKKHVRVRFFRSGWQISKVPGRDAAEIKMVHQEDAGLNVEIAKLAFAKGIWSYVCKMDSALRKFSTINTHNPSSAVSALTLMQQVPPMLKDIIPSASATGTTLGTSEEVKEELLRRPSKKFVTNSLFILGGLFCLSRGHSSLGAKVAVAYVLSKWNKLLTANRVEAAARVDKWA